MPQEFAEHPRRVFERNVWINPFWEDSVTGLIDLLGAERVCFGSDYPHPEGLADPLSWSEEIAGLPAGDVERIMSRNLSQLLAA
jgi:predicted TIM-barrel fold metal-dependent hydrolase